MQLKSAWASCLVLFPLLLGAAPLHGACVANADTLCLNSQRFEVKVSWTDFQGHNGVGKAVPLTSDTGYFWFFSATNVELVIKVLDGRGVNGKFWVFYGALSSVRYTITVRDTQSGAVRTYLNPSGNLGSVGDTQAFSRGGSSVAQSSPVASALAASAWPMFRGDLLHTARSAYSGPAEATLKWSYRMSGTVGSSPVIGTDGTIYVAAYSGILSALRPDGTLKWAFPTGGPINTASPAIASDQTIYIGSSDSKLYAIGPDGSLKWTYTTGGGIDSSPAIGLNGTVYFGASDGKVYGVRADGTLKWSYQTGGMVQSSPAIGVDGTIYVGSSDRSFYALHANGTLKWKYDTTGYITGSPAIAPDGTVYFVYNNGKLVALRSDGTLKWEAIPYMGGFLSHDSSPAIASDGTVYVGSYNGNLYAIRPDGTVKWSYATGSDVTSSPAIAVGGTIFVGSNDRKLHAIRSDGTPKWSYETGSSVVSSPAIGSDGTVYFGSNDQSLYAIGSPPCNGPQTLCLNNDRFRIEATWKDFQGNTGRGQAVPLTSDTGYFWFFNAANVEVVIKALDARPVNDRYWIFYGALSSVEYTITVTDTLTGAVKMFRNPSGILASVGDTDAFQDPSPSCTQPSITAQPQSTSIVSGSTATLSVQATGTAPRYQWFIGNSGNPGSPIVDATEPTYRTPPSTTARSYWVLVTNRCGSANSATATVSVNAPPTIGGAPFKIGGGVTTDADDFDVAATGDMLVAWIGRPDSGPIDLSIFGQHLSPTGAPIGTKFLVSTARAYGGYGPHVGASRQGGDFSFAVTWGRDRGGEQGGGGVFRIYNDAFQAVTPEREVSFDFSKAGGGPSHALFDLAGDLLLAWNRDSVQKDLANWFTPVSGAYHLQFDAVPNVQTREIFDVATWGVGNAFFAWGDNTAIYGSRFAQQLIPQGAPFEIAKKLSTLHISHAHVACSDGGDCLVIWLDSDTHRSIFGRIYDSLGSPKGAPFRVSPETVIGGEHVVTALRNGTFAVAMEDVFTGQVLVRRVSTAGALTTVDTFTGFAPLIAAAPGGGFVVLWKEWNPSTAKYEVWGRVFAAN